MDGRTNERAGELRRLPRRNIKLNKRSIFCSLFLTGVELRHFATLFSLRPLASLPSSLLPPSPAAPVRACTLFLPLVVSLPRSSSSSSSSSSACSSVSLLASPSFSLRPVRRNEPRRGEALYQSRVRSAWFIFYFGRGPNCKINTSS